MLLLLPPSEGKTPASAGAAVDRSALSHPGLTEARLAVAAELARASSGKDAASILGLGKNSAADAAWNLDLDSAPADFAARVYTGVLFDAARASSWDGETLQRAAERVRIVSALWGVVSPADHIPAYRLSMGTTLPNLGRMASFWKPRLELELDTLANGKLVVDCRSADYVAAYRPRGSWVSIKVLRELDGKRSVVTHMAKHTRGLLAGALVASDSVPESAADLAHSARALLDDALVDASLESGGNGPDVLTLVVRASEN